MADSVWRLPQAGTCIAVLASCHVRPEAPSFPEALIPRLQGADLIVTLGDMGAKWGLDRLEEIAPVLGLRGKDDEYDLRTQRDTLVLEGQGYRIGCVVDAIAAGLATDCGPFVEAPDADEACRRLFGGPIDLLLHASPHQADEAQFGAKGSALNPGSPLQQAEGSRPSFLRLKVGADGCFGQFIWVA